MNQFTYVYLTHDVQIHEINRISAHQNNHSVTYNLITMKFKYDVQSDNHDNRD